MEADISKYYPKVLSVKKRRLIAHANENVGFSLTCFKTIRYVKHSLIDTNKPHILIP